MPSPLATQLAALPGLTPGRLSLTLAEPAGPLALQNLDGIGPKLAQKLRERGILDQLDLLLFMPRKYQKIAHFMPAEAIFEQGYSHVELYGEIVQIRAPRPNTRQPVEIVVRHETKHFRLVWFNMERSSFYKAMREGQWLRVEGDIQLERGVPTMLHPTTKLLTEEPEPEAPYVSISPVYPTMEGVAALTLRKAQLSALSRLLPLLADIVPRELMLANGLPGIAQALSVIHVMRNYHDVAQFMQELTQARHRLIYEEFFTLQVSLASEYDTQRQRAKAPRCEDRALGRALVRALPFPLTNDQREAGATIAADMQRHAPMRRLLQGDVGSGKTVVAFMAAAIAVGSGCQVALMAPTDILARQHVQRAQQFFTGLPITIDYLGGAAGAAQRRDVLARLADGTLQLIIGTHALFQDDVMFQSLGLVIIDEQHKFGVEQRDKLLAKGQDPHLLAMTATPIPRSLAHAVYGDLDLLVLREKPPGRKPVRTVLRTRAVAPKVYDYVRERILDNGEQAYMIYPLVEASEGAPERENVQDAAQQLQAGPFHDLSVEVMHGRMDNAAKDAVMQRFASGQTQVLCATTVVEVGVDVPNATLMVIESPEIFGLSQLHQLRGRVGRGDRASMCVLLAGAPTEDAVARLTAFSQTEDGFELAEADLKQRGPGQFLGIRQAGHAEFRFGDLMRDAALLTLARRDARRLVLGDDDPADAPDAD